MSLTQHKKTHTSNNDFYMLSHPQVRNLYVFFHNDGYVVKETYQSNTDNSLYRITY